MDCLRFARYWRGARQRADRKFDLQPSVVPRYALYSVRRIAVAYVVQPRLRLVYGYVAAHNAKAERFMVPLLDTLQSIPVLSFLPGVMLSMVALFPTDATRRGVGLDSADFHRAGVEHDL